MSYRFFISVLFVLGFACQAPGQRPGTMAFRRPTAPDFRRAVVPEDRRSVVSEFPFQFRDGLIWLEVKVPQSRQPLQFLLDSGAEASVVNLRTAKRLRLRLGEPVVVEGVETVSKGFWPQFLPASIGGVELPEKYLAVDLGHVSRACQRAVDGLVGADFFSRHVVRIDFAARVIQVLETAHPAPTSEIVRLEAQSGGMRVPVNVNDAAQQWVRLDTGCATALEWVPSTAAPVRCANQIAVALRGPSRPMIRTDLRVGKTNFASVPTGVHTREIFPGESGLIGNGVLGRFATVTIDIPGGRLILDRPQTD
jgi:hypothetical protein